MDLTQLARRYYDSYLIGDRAFLEDNLADDFTFTSPYDDHIGRDEYFRRCWPHHPKHQAFHFEAMAQDGDKVLTAYRLDMQAGGKSFSFRNAECMRFESGKLKSVEVFFGDPPRGITRQQFAVQSGAG